MKRTLFVLLTLALLVGALSACSRGQEFANPPPAPAYRPTP